MPKYDLTKPRVRPPTPSLGLVRTILLALNLIGCATFALELYGLHHFNEPLQWIAVAAIALGALGLLAALSSQALVRALTFVAALGLMLSGALGFAVHLWRNHLLQPEAPLSSAFSGPLPALAPLALANLGLLMALMAWLPGPARNPSPRASSQGRRSPGLE